MTCTPTASRSPPGWTPARTSSAARRPGSGTTPPRCRSSTRPAGPTWCPATRTDRTVSGAAPLLAALPQHLDHVRRPDVLVEHRVPLTGHPHVGVGRCLALLHQVALLDQAADRGELLLVPAPGGLPAV